MQKKTFQFLSFFLSTLLLTSCIGKPDISINIKGSDISSGAKEEAKASLVSADIKNDIVTIEGANLTSVIEVRLKNNSGLDELLVIEQKTATTLLAKASGPLVIPLYGALSLLIKDSFGATTYPLTFELQDGVVTGAKINTMGASVGQVLMFDGTSWAPGDLSGLIYAGNWDANSGLAPNLSPGAGEYYIVNNAGTTSLNGINSWAVGDWAVWNSVDSQWEKIDNASNVTSFNGRGGVVVPAAGDYSISDLSGVDLTGAANGKVLKYNGTNWVVADDLTGGGAGTVTETELQNNSVTTSKIADGTITDADIDGAAGIAQSKIAGLATALSGKLSLTGGTLSGPIDMGGENISNPGTVDGVDVSALSSAVSTNSTGISNNASAISANTVNISSNATDIAANTTSITSIANRNVEDFTTACADNKILMASGGNFVCADAVGGALDPDSDIILNGDAAKEFSLTRNPVADTAGNNLSIISSGATTGATNKDGGSLILSSGTSTGYGQSMIDFKTAGPGTTGTADSNPTTKMTLNGNGYLTLGHTNNSSHNISIYRTTPGSPSIQLTSSFTGNGSADGGVMEYNGIVYGLKNYEAGGIIRLSNAEENYALEVKGDRVSINKYSPNAHLEISQGGATVTDAFMISSTDVAAGDRIIVKGSGDVGINTITPSEKLEVVGNVKATAFIGDGSQLTGVSASSSSSTTTTVVAADSDANGSGDISFTIAGAERFKVLNNGNVGIGTSTPSSMLDVAGTIRAQQLCDENGANCQDLSSGISPVLTGLSRGSSAAPTIRFGTDTNTGIYSPATDQVGISVGGVLDARFNSNAISFYKRFNVTNYNNTSVVPELGTSASGSINAGAIVGEHVFDYGGRITPDRASIYLEASENFSTSAQGASLNFSTILNGTTTASKKMTIANNGYVGIGSHTPTSLFHIREPDDSWASSFRMDRSWESNVDYFQMMYDYEGLKIRTMADDADEAHIIFKPLDSEAMRITEDGKVGIGNSTPSVALSVNGDMEATSVTALSMSAGTLGVVSGVSGNVLGTFRNTSITGVSGFSFRAHDNADTGFIGFVNPSVPAPYPAGTVTLQGIGVPVTLGMSNYEVMRVHTDGNVGIGTTGPTEKLEVAGCVKHSGGTIGTSCSSDRRLKDHIEDIDFGDDSLEHFLMLRPRTYVYRSDYNSVYYGFIAQEVEEIDPTLLGENNSQGYKTVNYERAKWLHFKATQAIGKKLKNAELKISELEKRNALLESYLCEKDPDAPFCL